MRTYISGKITGLDIQEVNDKFYGVEVLLQDIGLEAVNPLRNGLNKDTPWHIHLAKDIELLLQCDAIYLMDNWVDSLGATIEYDIAKRMGMHIFFETSVEETKNELIVYKAKENKYYNELVASIEKAIMEVTGMKFNQYATRTKKRDSFFARIIFVHHCRKARMKLKRIARYIHRDHSSILYMLKKYQDEMMFNQNFRYIAKKVETILNKNDRCA